MILQLFSDIVNDELSFGAILNEEYVGFREDYLVLHCLLRKYKPTSFLEIGTNMGTGTKIIKNALGVDAKVYSLDLPTELAHISLQHPINEGKGDSVGHKCDLPYEQIRADSMNFDYASLGSIDGWFIDGEHDYVHPYHESLQAIKMKAKIIIFHDSDILEVGNAINDAFSKNTKKYDLYRVTDTRIAYAISK